MRKTATWILAAALAGLTGERWCEPVQACAGVGRQGKPVLNADQTVLMVWNAAARTQHFIRQANFKSAGDDFGFLVPTPSTPELAEAGDAAFAYLKKLTEPAVVRKALLRNGETPKSAAASVRVLSEQDIAGFHATVLEADKGVALAKWLSQHGFDFSPAVAAWADPYVKRGWKFTALKIAKGQGEGRNAAAKALRITFKTEQPLFPYREPESGKDEQTALRAYGRMLRMFFVAETQYESWLGDQRFEQTAWSGALTKAQRAELHGLLKLKDDDAPVKAWLTEIEHHWPYELAAEDVAFRPAKSPTEIRREPHVEYYYADDRFGSPLLLVGAVGAAIAAAAVFWRRRGK